MKQIKPGEYKSSVCNWCSSKAELVSLKLTGPRRYACRKHQNNLSKLERALQSYHMSEADYQTWGRL